MSSSQTQKKTLGLLLAPSLVVVAWLSERLSYYWNTDPDLSFGWIVLMLAGYVLWEALEESSPPNQSLGPLSCILYITGLLMMAIFQVYTAAMGVMPAAVWGLALGYVFIVTANLISTVNRSDFFRFAFAFLFVLVALPLPSLVDRLVVGGLQNVVAVWVVEALNIMGIPAIKEGSLVRLPGGMVGVDEACSGIRSLQSTVMATLFIGYLTLKRFDTRVTLFFVGCGFAVLGNLIRALMLSLSAAQNGIESVDEVHDLAGWGILAFTVVGVAAAGFLIQRFEKQLKLALGSRLD